LPLATRALRDAEMAFAPVAASDMVIGPSMLGAAQ